MFSLKPLERTLHEKPRAEWIENNKNNVYTMGKWCCNLLSEIRNEKVIRKAEDKVVWILQNAEQKDEEADDLKKKKGGIDPGVLTC